MGHKETGKSLCLVPFGRMALLCLLEMLAERADENPTYVSR